MRKGRTGVALATRVCAALWLHGCEPAGGGDAAVDASDASDVGPACITVPDGMIPTEPRPHIDCFGGVRCIEGTVYVSAIQPLYYCSQEEIDRVFQSVPDACEMHGRTIRCASGRCGSLIHRYARCRAAEGPYARPYDPAVVRAFCDGATVAAGARCEVDADCRPAIDQPDYALRCDRETSMCVQVPRPPRPADFGQPCVGGLEGCATTEAACGGYRRTAVCSLDEDCPAGFDCAQLGNLICTGVCVPRGSRSPSSLVPCAVFNSDADAGAEAATDAATDASDERS